jgi:hypothetical protein
MSRTVSAYSGQGGPFRPYRQDLEGRAEKVAIDDTDDGLLHAYRLNGQTLCEVLVTPSAAKLTAIAAAEAAEDRPFWTNNTTRLDLLSRRAARYARDPVVNAADQLSARLQHELLARLALALLGSSIKGEF